MQNFHLDGGQRCSSVHNQCAQSQIRTRFFFTFSQFPLISHSGPENLKKTRPKKLVKSDKSISRKKIL